MLVFASRNQGKLAEVCEALSAKQTDEAVLEYSVGFEVGMEADQHKGVSVMRKLRSWGDTFDHISD